MSSTIPIFLKSYLNLCGNIKGKQLQLVPTPSQFDHNKIIFHFNGNGFEVIFMLNEISMSHH